MKPYECFLVRSGRRARDDYASDRKWPLKKRPVIAHIKAFFAYFKLLALISRSLKSKDWRHGKDSGHVGAQN